MCTFPLGCVGGSGLGRRREYSEVTHLRSTPQASEKPDRCAYHSSATGVGPIPAVSSAVPIATIHESAWKGGCMVDGRDSYQHPSFSRSNVMQTDGRFTQKPKNDKVFFARMETKRGNNSILYLSDTWEVEGNK